MYTKLDPTVLRQSLFGDVQLRHDLESADNGRLKSIDLGGRRLRMQDAVDPVTDQQAVRLAFDMHVAGSRLNRFQQDLIDQSYDRRLLSHLAQFAAIGLDFFQ